MNVKELIEELSKLDPEAQVILQRDPEGNGYSPISGAEEAPFIQDGRDIEVYDYEYTAEDNCMEEDEWEEIKNSKENKCVIIWPTF